MDAAYVFKFFLALLFVAGIVLVALYFMYPLDFKMHVWALEQKLGLNEKAEDSKEEKATGKQTRASMRSGKSAKQQLEERVDEMTSKTKDLRERMDAILEKTPLLEMDKSVLDALSRFKLKKVGSDSEKALYLANEGLAVDGHFLDFDGKPVAAADDYSWALYDRASKSYYAWDGMGKGFSKREINSTA